MRLIDADLIEFEKPGVMPNAKFEHAMANNVILCGRNSKKEMTSALLLAKCMIDEQPTVDAVPVVHAHWEYDPNANDWGIGGWCCSKCHFKNDILGTSNKLPLPIKLYAGVRYCAQCGAKMDEVTKDET